MNRAQKQILADSAVIDEQSGGTVKLTYHKDFEGRLWWNIYNLHEQVATIDTAAAHEFCRGWKLAVQYSPLPR